LDFILQIYQHFVADGRLHIWTVSFGHQLTAVLQGKWNCCNTVIVCGGGVQIWTYAHCWMLAY